MLNLSPHSVKDEIRMLEFKSFSRVSSQKYIRKLSKWLLFMGFLLLGIMFLPWTQNIKSEGVVTALRPGERLQTVQSAIPGRIEKWYVREGDFVNKGDTIIFLSEIKDTYLDPSLVERTVNQLLAKEASLNSYDKNIMSLESRITSLNKIMQLKEGQVRNKIEQQRLKISSDSIALEAAKTNIGITEFQLERTRKLFDEGLKSLIELEEKKLKYQEAQAKLIGTKNKLLSSNNDWINEKIELVNLSNEYNEKKSKAEADKFKMVSARYEAESEIEKLKNQLRNYEIRAGYYYITAPQEGYVVKTLKSGKRETIKEGTAVASIIPKNFQIAAELYVKPYDLPLIDTGQKVRVIFDGWPAMVFSGWPGASLGSFPGSISTVDRAISDNGKYRILVTPDENEKWPDLLRVGSGVRGWALLRDVPIWYELWRQLNGFPPDFYKRNNIKGKINNENVETK